MITKHKQNLTFKSFGPNNNLYGFGYAHYGLEIESNTYMLSPTEELKNVIKNPLEIGTFKFLITKREYTVFYENSLNVKNQNKEFNHFPHCEVYPLTDSLYSHFPIEITTPLHSLILNKDWLKL
jgi:hypothetical protein